MKKLILITIILFQIVNCTAQIYIDKDLAYIKSMNLNKDIDVHYCKDNTKTISISTNNGTFVYYFNKDEICINYIQVPFNFKCMENIRNFYNKEYTIVSDTIWKTKEGILITLNIGIDEIYFQYVKT